MGATLGTLLQKQTIKLGTSETALYTDDKRVAAINQAIENILEEFDIPQYTIKTQMSFVGGTATLPDDCLRALKLSDVNNYVYRRVNFDTFEYNLSGVYSIEWDETSSTEIMKLYPLATTALFLWYVKYPTALSDDGDTIRFKGWWDDAIALKSVSILLADAQRTDVAQVRDAEANALIAKAWQTERTRLTGEEEQRLTSVYQKQSLLRSSGSREYAYAYSNSTDNGLTWQFITVGQVLMSNIGYNVNSNLLIEMTLPPVCNVGDIIQIVGVGTGGWKLNVSGTQQVIVGNLATTINGYIASTYYNDNIALECISPLGIWTRIGSGGNISVN